VLALILGLSAFCNFYQLQQNGFANLYYAAAIRSMLESWHNFFYVAFDPGGFVSIDKPPLGFWIQAASARLLGYSGYSILLPEALAGVLSVGLLYLLVRRVFGPSAGLLAALFLAISPVSVVTNRNNTIDSLLVLTVLLGAYAVSRAAEQGSLRWLLLTAVLVGLGFNIKMLEAYLVVPAFAAVYLLVAPLPWWRRLLHLAAAGFMLLAVSLAWIVAVDLIPASSRPYVGSSSTNSELQLALGYNGIQRLLGRFIDVSSLGSAISSASAPGGPGGISENGAPGFFRLLNAQLGGQTSWLLALCVVGVLAGGWGWRFHRRLSRTQSALALWGLWTVTQVVFFSVAGFFHRYYLSMLAPSIAALAGISIVLLWRDYLVPGWRGWLLPVALVATALSQAVILGDYSGWNIWLTPLIVAGSVSVAALLIVYRLARYHHLALPPALLARGTRDRARIYLPLVIAALGVALLLVGPATWVGISLAAGSGGTLPAAGPSPSTALLGGQFGSFPGGRFSGSPRRAPQGFTGGFPAGGLPPGRFSRIPANSGSGTSSLQIDSGLIAYLEAHQGKAKYLFATSSSQTAAPYIISTGRPVMALGGFSGSDPILTLEELQSLIRQGEVRYFYFGFGGAGFGGAGFGGGGAGNGELVRWVESTCKTISATSYGGSSGGGTLYACGG
jgi:4-amino-4-deoxy-L-arabinose transferase-like glycosyltransferase